MRVAIDGSAIPKQMAGAGVYTYQLIRALGSLETEHEFVTFARDGLFDDISSLNIVRVGSKNPALRLAWEQAILPLLLRRHRIDLLHSPHHHTPLIIGPGIRRVVTFNDVTFLRLPDRYPAIRRAYMATVTRAAARVADAVIAPSDAVRDDVIERLNLKEERVTVVPDAAGPQYRPSTEADIAQVRAKHGLEGSYVISVSSLEPGKNRTRLIRAFASLRDRHPRALLVVVGQPAWNFESDHELIKELGLDQHVRFLGYVPDEDLPPLYSGAKLLALPSLYEGFGLPILESMACDTPVVTSNVGATAEIAGDAALLVDPYDTDAIASAIDRLLSEEQFRADLRARGRVRANEYSWARTARETLAVYEGVLAG